MPFIVEQRKPACPIKMFTQWSECADSKRISLDEMQAELDWWLAYDEYYSCSGWEYRIREVKK